jgi:predicted metal-dependent hydrolase
MWMTWGPLGVSLWTGRGWAVEAPNVIIAPYSLTCGNPVHRVWSKNFSGRHRAPRRVTVRTVATMPTDAGAVRAVEVRRSARRRRTVSAYRDGDRTVVLIPARFSKAEERRWVAEMLDRLAARDQRRQSGPRRSDAALMARARQLSTTVLDGKVRPDSVRWVSNMSTRWGSCTPADSSIRVSSRLRGMPTWVLDYVLVHELAHLAVPGHGADFWDLVQQYPRAERARGYLEGVAAAAHLELEDDLPEQPGE